ncbi:hypothetical protein M422DRAFT_260457 [Sphaerobolus stellatus SS14]|uniref:Uncharacterized protein n=1 Tax=Sphaerobolus stellatus (strain SS14) TaxID=990650 RepID=A0A0C9U2L6_SPHS4|nr:hypothetical protein M422DRAFT_260457 [Sphaerobolus stellatus SS14]
MVLFFLGIIADHGDFPIERLKLDRQGKWLGSASHDEVLKLTDVGDALEESDDEKDGDDKEADQNSDDEETAEAGLGDVSPVKREVVEYDEDSDEQDSDKDQKKKKRRKKNKDETGPRKKGALATAEGFFADL